MSYAGVAVLMRSWRMSVQGFYVYIYICGMCYVGGWLHGVSGMCMVGALCMWCVGVICRCRDSVQWLCVVLGMFIV